MPQRNSLPLTVYRNGLVTTDLEVISIGESAGVERLDIAHLLYKNLNLEGRNFHSSIVCEEIEIVRTDTGEVLHWGKIGIVPPELNPVDEALIVVSRTEKFHLGDRLNGYWVWNPTKYPAAAAELISHDLVFNPLIDDKIEGNLNDTRTSEQDDDEPPNEIGHPLFLNPESVRTEAARTLQGADAITWPVSKCIHYLLQSLNADETYITNPTLATIVTACNDTSDKVLNTTIPRGTYLAEALDLLLAPLGYRWKVERTAVGARRYAFFQRNAGSIRWVHHQVRGSTLAMAETNVEAAGMKFDVTNLANQVTIVGGYFGYEVTVELARGWPEAQDDLDESRYANTDENFASVKDAWRRWVLNEAGDYIGFRPEINGVFTEEFRDDLVSTFGEEIWDEFVPCRRKFFPTLTLKEDLTPIGKHAPGIDIEYHNPNYDVAHPENEPEWKPIGNWGCDILGQEAGLYFNGEFPPLAKIGADDRNDIRIRVTATIESDKRLEDTATRDVDSPQDDIAPLLIDAPTKFRWQKVTTLSKYNGGPHPSLEQDDVVSIVDFAERVRLVWDLMDVGGALQLAGLDCTDVGTPYQVGQRVQGILGKGISFRAKTGVEEYPQIVAIERNIDRQTMTLYLQRHADPLGMYRPRKGRR